MVISLRVQPRASRNLLKREAAGKWKLYLTAPPVDGKANEACIEFLSRLLRIPSSRVRIISGLKSREKIVELVGVDEQIIDSGDDTTR